MRFVRFFLVVRRMKMIAVTCGQAKSYRDTLSGDAVWRNMGVWPIAPRPANLVEFFDADAKGGQVLGGESVILLILRLLFILFCIYFGKGGRSAEQSFMAGTVFSSWPAVTYLKWLSPPAASLAPYRGAS